jgi:uncharacterized protein (UPF0261 family)
MRIKRVLKMAHHRNGVAGTPFDVVIFRDTGQGGSVKLGIVFDERGYCAVLDIAKLAEHDIAFGSNSWRGDDYEHDLRRMIADAEVRLP